MKENTNCKKFFFSGWPKIRQIPSTNKNLY